MRRRSPAPPVSVHGVTNVLRYVALCRRGRRPVLTGAPLNLVHDSGFVLAGADGEPLRFASRAQASEFARRYLCDPLAYRVHPAAGAAAA